MEQRLFESTSEIVSNVPGKSEPRSSAQANDGAFVKPLLEAQVGQQVTGSRATRFRRLLALADAVAISVALLLAEQLESSGHLKLAAYALPLLFIFCMKIAGLYDRDEYLLHRTTLDELPTLFGVATTAALMLSLTGEALVTGAVDRQATAAFWMLLMLWLVGLRVFARTVARASSPTERCLFVGPAPDAEELSSKLAATRGVKAELVGAVPADKERLEQEDVSRLAQRVFAAASECSADRVVLGAGPGSSDEFLDSLRRLNIKVSLLPNLPRVVHASAEIDRLEGMTLLGLHRLEISVTSRFVKRCFDVVGALVCLLTSAPVLIVVAVAIKLETQGPVIYRQRRAGRHGVPFTMFKLRSMVRDADERRDELLHLNEADGVFKVADDPRITRVGRFVRRIHLDELPQMINVLLGQMSLVGPRPLPLEEDRRIEGWHRRRLDIRPGVTGPWQVLGSSRIPVREMVKLDYQYVSGWSIWTDIRIVLLTLGHVARRGGQ